MRAVRPRRGIVAEKAFADINGERQGMFIQSADASYPVLLYLHGGLPEYFLNGRYPAGLDDDFTVVWWEQRGAGLSYRPVLHAEREGQAVARQFSSGVSALWDEMLAVDLADRVPELALPAYFFHGVYDYTVNYQLAKDYVGQLKAPLKGFYTFERSAHSPVMEEPQKARTILRRDVLAGTNSLADGSSG